MGFFSTDPKPISTLSTEQEQLMKTLGPKLSALASAGPEGSTYQGALSAPITDAEQTNVNNASRFGAIAGGTLSDLSNYNDTNFNNQFQSEIADPTFSNFRTNVQPYLEQELPTFSTARVNVIAKGLNDLQNNVMQQRFTAREAAKDRALRAATGGADFYSTQQKTIAAPREIAQAGLDRQFLNFYQGNEQYQKGIASMLDYLGIQTKGFVNQPSGADKVGTVLSLANSLKNLMPTSAGA